MTTYVLVQGAWHGSWCWKRVRNALRAQGHDVYTPTLTGVGELSHLLSPDVNLDTHINDVINLIKWEELTDVVLVGHSYGGCVIRGVADRIGERIAKLVYLDAFVLENGESLHDTLPAEQRQMQLDLTKQYGDGWKVPPIPGEVFAVNAADCAWVNSQCTMQPIATFQQKLALQGKAEPKIPTLYILASGWNDSPFPKFHERALAKGWKTMAIACGHDVMLDCPEELTQALLAA
jgi:pimeloyl-ACP methyl ester carboxylesterase